MLTSLLTRGGLTAAGSPSADPGPLLWFATTVKIWGLLPLIVVRVFVGVVLAFAPRSSSWRGRRSRRRRLPSVFRDRSVADVEHEVLDQIGRDRGDGADLLPASPGAQAVPAALVTGASTGRLTREAHRTWSRVTVLSVGCVASALDVLGRRGVTPYLLVPCDTDPCSCRWKMR